MNYPEQLAALQGKLEAMAAERDAYQLEAARMRQETIDHCAGTAWVFLMDYCKERRMPPADNNRLFNLVSAIRALQAADTDDKTDSGHVAGSKLESAGACQSHGSVSDGEITDDQCIELAEELCWAAMRKAIAETKAIALTNYDFGYQCGMEAACEEIESRLGLTAISTTGPMLRSADKTPTTESRPNEQEAIDGSAGSVPELQGIKELRGILTGGKSGPLAWVRLQYPNEPTTNRAVAEAWIESGWNVVALDAVAASPAAPADEREAPSILAVKHEVRQMLYQGYSIGVNHYGNPLLLKDGQTVAIINEALELEYERRLFEAHMRKDGWGDWSLSRSEMNGLYADGGVERYWKVWQAARRVALSAAPAIPEGWISVETRLPDFRTDNNKCFYVLIAYPASDGWQPSKPARAWFAPESDETPDMYWHGCDSIDFLGAVVTHWMPLPKSPLAATQQEKP